MGILSKKTFSFKGGVLPQLTGGLSHYYGAATGDQGDTANWITDPLDMFGTRAKAAQDQADAILRGSLDAQAQAQMDAYRKQVGLQQPYYDAGVNALSQLSTPGTIPLSAQYNRDLEQGSRALNRSLAASGQFRSSNAYDKFGQFYNQLSGQEAGRQYNNALAPIKIAQDAMGSMGGAADTYGAGMSNAYNNYGQQGAQNALAYGQNRADTYNTIGQSLGSVANYYGSR